MKVTLKQLRNIRIFWLVWFGAGTVFASLTHNVFFTIVLGLFFMGQLYGFYDVLDKIRYEHEQKSRRTNTP
jgi:hypothetical protein